VINPKLHVHRFFCNPFKQNGFVQSVNPDPNCLQRFIEPWSEMHKEMDLWQMLCPKNTKNAKKLNCIFNCVPATLD
jgi:hypothetical protein